MMHINGNMMSMVSTTGLRIPRPHSSLQYGANDRVPSIEIESLPEPKVTL